MKKIRMTNDILYALGVLVVFVGVIAKQSFHEGALEGLLSLTRPGATTLLLAVIVYLYIQQLMFTMVAVTVVVIFLLKDVWTNWVRSDARRLYLDVGRDQARFDQSTSIDLQFANGTVTHRKPKMLRKDHDVSPLLIYPPSSGTLEEMCGV
jgi:hypothetical protein